MIDAIEKLVREQFEELMSGSVAGVAEELRIADEGKLTVGVSFKLSRIGARIYVKSSVSYARKFTGESEGMTELPDPNQPDLLPREKAGSK